MTEEHYTNINVEIEKIKRRIALLKSSLEEISHDTGISIEELENILAR